MLKPATIVEKSASKLAAGVLAHGATRLLSLGRVVQWEGVLVVERDRCAAKVGSALGLAASIWWIGRPVEPKPVGLCTPSWYA